MWKMAYIEYEAEIREYRLSLARDPVYIKYAYLAILLIILGMGLDYALYPAKQIPFGLARIVIAGLIFGAILIMRTAWGKDCAQWLTFGWLLLTQVMISWMISDTEGAASSYCSGLYLAIFAASVALPFNFGENILFSVLSCGTYLVACSFHPETFALKGPLLANLLFLFMSAAVSALCTYVNDRGRLMLLRLKAELARKNEQLEETNRDLTQIKGQMLQQEKMAAIGTLAAGLLHEINNPVNFCLMAINLAMDEPKAKESPTLTECLVDAKDGMQRVHHIVSDLKIFAYRKPGTEVVGQPFLFEKALSSAERLTGHELRGIDLVHEIDADNLVFGDEAAIIGVLINLLSNAALAMRGASSQKSEIRVSAAWREGRLHITVRDNGPGISPQNLPRIFEPFFTTREIGQGLGLGLSICYGIIERHGGVLAASSVLGEWTEFAFDLPRAE